VKLALFTDRPAFEKPVQVGAPIVEKEVQQNYYKIMAKVFDGNYFTNNGPLVQQLEHEIARIHNVRHCIAVCNATVAQMLVLKGLNLEGEIILPSFTFIATAHACQWQNLKPVFCDISPTSLMLDVKKVEELINEKTCAIIGVHMFGNVCNVEKLQKMSKDYGLQFICDATHAFNCSFGDVPIGGFGKAEILSFHATKFFSTFEGGVVLTNDLTLNSCIRSLRNFGFRDYDDVGCIGINGKMSEASAAMGLASLPVLDSRIERLQKNYNLYREHLSSIPGISLLPVGEDGNSNFMYVVILLEEKTFGVSRDVLCKILLRENVIARRYFYPGCHRMEPYNTLFPDAYKKLPVTENVVKKVLCLPTNLPEPELDIVTIVDCIRTVSQNAHKILQCAETYDL
jgi:dTDP-4-amino-4,6-dideoxygalactose transaminase